MAFAVRVLGLSGLLLLLVVMAGWRRLRWQGRRAWLGRRLGLSLVPSGPTGKPVLAGMAGAVPVVMDVVELAGTYATRLILHPPGMPDTWTLEAGPQVHPADDLEDAAGTCATAQRHGVTAEDGALLWVQPGRYRDPQAALRALRAMQALIGAMNWTDERGQLLRSVHQARGPGAAATALQSFLERWRLTPAEAAALLAHRWVGVQLLAAAAVGLAARSTVEAVVRSPQSTPPIRAEALDILRRMDLHGTVPLALEIVARSNPGEVTVAALNLLADAQTCPPLADLADSVEIRSTTLRTALARCLHHSTAPAEALLLVLLADPDDGVATAAAEALAVQGTTAAVMPLRKRVGDLFEDRRLRAATEAAIAAIQGDGAGRLSGGLSLAAGAAVGGLSEAVAAASEPSARSPSTFRKTPEVDS